MAAVAQSTSGLNGHQNGSAKHWKNQASTSTGETSVDSKPPRKLFGRTRKVAPLNPKANDVFTSTETNISSSALSNGTTTSKKSRFFRRFTRSFKTPPVPSLPPALILDLDAGTAKSSLGTSQPVQISQSDIAAIRSMQQQGHSAAAAVIAESNAAFAAAQSVPRPIGEQRKKMLDAMANARLDVSQARDLVRMCGRQIRERGLDTVGLFRSFRVAASQDRVLFILQLFLLSIDTSTYMAVFPILPENVLDRLGKQSEDPLSDKRKVAQEELDKELRYASPHEVVSVMKWGLRHLRLRHADFHSKDAEEWYDMFVAAERETGYHARAIADLLHPKLPQETAELLSEILDLMASVAAHSASNLMSAAAICKILGFWLFGRIGVAHPPPTFDELLRATEKASGVAEHLLLAHIRSQAAVTFSMPSRLTELVENYPYIKPDSEAPSLPPAFESRSISTLRIDLKSENLVVSQAKPRTPSATLSAALDATASDKLQGDRGEAWAAITSQLDGDAVPERKGEELLIDEHARILRLVDEEMEVRARSQEEPPKSSFSASSAGSGVKTGEVGADSSRSTARRRSQSVSDLQAGSLLATLPEGGAWGSVGATKGPAKPRKTSQKIDAATEDDPVEVVADNVDEFGAAHGPADGAIFSGGLEPSSSWKSFSEEGFGGMSTASSDLSLSEFDIKSTSSPSKSLPSRRSHRSLHRTKSSSSRRPALPHAFTSPDARYHTTPETVHTVTAARMTSIDVSLSTLWQDQLLDQSPCCSLPVFVFVQLNDKTSSVAATHLSNDTSYKDDLQHSPSWLLIIESIIPPRPPTPPNNASHANGYGRRHQRWDTDSASFSDRKSIFAPSIRSVRSTLRRVSTIIGGNTKKKPSFQNEELA